MKKFITFIRTESPEFRGIIVVISVVSGIVNCFAVALAIGSFNLMYLLGPVIGAVLGMWTYKLLSNEKQ